MLENEFKKMQVFVRNATRICILSHKNPDGDTLGSNIALRFALEQQGKQVVSVCADEIPEKYFFLSGVDQFQRSVDLSSFDLIIMVDIAAKHLVGFDQQQQAIFSFFPLVNIDHHPDNPLFANLNLVDAQQSSTTMILYHLFTFLNIPITKDMATALLLGIYNDTGSFMHANTTLESYKIASSLLSLGANAKFIVQRLYKTFPINRLQLWGKVFNRIHINPQHVVSSVITKEDFQETNTSAEDLSGVVEYLNMVPDGQYAMLLTDDASHTQVKASLRTLNDDVDVSSIAHKFGGGGHKKASGFRIPGKIEEEITWKIVNDQNEDVIKNISDI
jgi:phosphoesterase RecJ-like protein